MAEKGDLPTDQVSLPPTYAPSEAYTESPPPAYKRDGRAPVRVAKIICFTLLLMTFMVGSFIIVHKWVHQKECHCPSIVISKDENIIRKPEFLVAEAPKEKSLNEIEKSIKDETTKILNQVEKKEENEEKKLNDQIVEEMKKKIKLPVDMILGNPSLAGKDMNCNVEKRKQKIADGIFTESVIVTCENEDNLDLPFQPKMEVKKGAPPMSLLSHIMKTLLSKPKIDEQPKIFNPFIPQSQSGEEPLPFPVIRPKEDSLPMPPHNGFLRIVPIKKVVHRYNPVPEIRELPMPKQLNLPHPLLHPMVRKIILRPNNLREHEHSENEIPRPIIRPVPEHESSPFEPDTSNNSPIRIIRINGNELNGEQHPERPPFPFPFNPIMKMFPIRKARVLHVIPRPHENHHDENNMHEPVPRHFPHFDENHHEEGLHEHLPEASGRSLPSPRIAVPGGPEIKFVRLPNNQSPLLRLPGGGIVTHMEMRAPPPPPMHGEREEESFPPVLPISQEQQEFGPPKVSTVLDPSHEPIYRPQNTQEHFSGPHEESENNFPDFQNVSPEEEPIPIPQGQHGFFAHPPPRFRREGRISPVAELNPEADIYTEPHFEE